LIVDPTSVIAVPIPGMKRLIIKVIITRIIVHQKFYLVVIPSSLKYNSSTVSFAGKMHNGEANIIANKSAQLPN